MVLLVLPLVLFSWGVLSVWAAHRVGEWIADRGATGGLATGLRLEMKAVVLIVLLPLPLIDELLAKPQFDALCREQAVVTLHAGIAPGRTVRRVELPAEPSAGLLLPVLTRRRLYIDAETQQTLVSFNTLQAQPGKLGRLLGRGDGPLTFGGLCAPARQDALLSELGLQENLAGPGGGRAMHPGSP